MKLKVKENAFLQCYVGWASPAHMCILKVWSGFKIWPIFIPQRALTTISPTIEHVCIKLLESLDWTSHPFVKTTWKFSAKFCGSGAITLSTTCVSFWTTTKSCCNGDVTSWVVFRQEVMTFSAFWSTSSLLSSEKELLRCSDFSTRPSISWPSISLLE